MTDQRAAGILDTSVFIASETNRQLNTSLIPVTVLSLQCAKAPSREHNAGRRVAEIISSRLYRGIVGAQCDNGHHGLYR